MPRIKPRDILPTAVKSRNFGDIITSKPGDIPGNALEYSFSFGNSDQAVVTHTLETEDNSKLLAILDLSLYVGSVDSDNQIGNGSSIDESDYQIIGPWHDWGATDNKNVKIKIFILNISAGTVTIHGRAVWRYISNNPNAEIATS